MPLWAVNGSRNPSGPGDDEEGDAPLNDPNRAYTYQVSEVLQQISSTDNRAAQMAPVQKSTWDLKDAARGSSPWSELAYKYFNWRSGTGSDILLVILIVQVVTLLLAVVYSIGITLTSDQELNFWDSIYRVIKLFFQEFPDGTDQSAILVQMYAIATATIGLFFFTILLAMIEQLFMEIRVDRVERGSVVREKDHVLVLGWNDSALSITAMWIVMQQICEFHRPQGGTVIVVLCNESKTKMEALCKEYLPDSKRHGSMIVFRQGSPLVPSALERVAAKDAKATIIISDASRSAVEADAQSMRASVLLDEMHADEWQPRGRIIVELKTGLSAQLMRDVCSDYVFPISTYKINCARLARLVQRPITAYVSAREMCFDSTSQHFIHSFPQLAGVRFRDLKYYFPNATPYAVLNAKLGTCHVMPLDDYVLQEADEIDFLRDGRIPYWRFAPTRSPINPDKSVEWTEGMSRGSFDDRLQTLESFADSSPGGSWNDPLSKYDASLRDNVEDLTAWGSIEEGWTKSRDKIQSFGRSLSAAMESMGSGDMDEGSSSDEDNDENISTSISGAWSMTTWSSWDEEEMEEFNYEIGSIDESSHPMEDAKAHVLIIGSAEDLFMAATIEEMDRGLCPLTPGSEVTLFSLHVPQREGTPISEVYDCPEPQNISVSYIHGDPLNGHGFEELPLASYSNIVVLIDKAWLDLDNDDTNGIGATDTADMLRLDSMVMMVQINVRRCLAEIGIKNTRFVTEKLAFQGKTRFDDPFRLPIGSTLNRKDFAARFLAQVACQPKIFAIMAETSQATHFELRDPRSFIAEGLTMNYWTLMEIVEDAGELLLGYVELPQGSDRSVDVVINPVGPFRDVKIAWARRQLKLITTTRRQSAAAAAEPEKTGESSNPEVEPGPLASLQIQQQEISSSGEDTRLVE